MKQTILPTDGRWRMLAQTAAVVAGGVIVLCMAFLQRSQAEVLAGSLAKVRDFRVARLELSASLLRQGWAPASPATAGVSEESPAIFLALSHLENSLLQFEVDAEGNARAVETRIEALRRVVPPAPLGVTAARPAEAAALQQGYAALDEAMTRLDSYNARQLRALIDSQKLQFNLGVGAALLLLLSIGVFVLRNHRQIHRAEAGLRENESQLRQMVELMPQLVWSCDAKGRCDYLSSRWAAFAGEPVERFLGEGWLELIHPEDRERVARYWSAIVEAGSSSQQEYRIRRHDGVYRWFDVRAGLVFDVSGHPFKWFGSCTDITERKLVETELTQHRDKLEEEIEQRTAALVSALDERSKAQQRMHALIVKLREADIFVRMVADNVPGRIAYWDQELRCRFVNRSYGLWFGQVAEEIVGRTMQEFSGTEYFERFKPRVMAALAGEAQDYEREEYNAEGEYAVTRVQYLPDLRNGKVQGFFVLATNITRHKQAEQLLQLSNVQLAEARDRADAANRAKSDFLANMSHEIRTPMNAILGLTHMLRRDIENPTHQARLAKISNVANHLLQVINDILDLSKIEAGKLTLENVDFSLDALLARTCTMVQDAAHEKGLEVVLDTSHVPNRLNGDQTRLMQALLNMLSNAVKFTERGSVLLRAELVETDADGVLVRFEVRDTGIGIEPGVLPLLFTPFVQGDGSSTRRHGGSGLGLSIMRHIAELMGGQAGGESLPGEGSRFWISVRLRLAQEAEPALALAAPSVEAVETMLREKHRGVRVLLAEDNPVNQEVAADLLQAAGLVVDIAGDGEQAVRLARRGGYALILMDVQMPRMDGLEATRLLRQDPDPGVAHLPIIAMTANAFNEDRQACLRAGMNDHLAKPVDPRVLHEALLRWLPVRAQTASPPAPEAAASSEQQIAGIRHLDLAVTYAQCAHKPALAVRVLRQFLSHYRNVGTAMLDYLQAGELDELRRKLHSLRGAAGAVGAMQVLDGVTKMQAAMQAEASQAELLPMGRALSAELDALIAELAERLEA